MSAAVPPAMDPAAAGEMAREAAAWCALHGLVVGDRADQVSPSCGFLASLQISMYRYLS